MKRALVIEDNENNMELITFILELSGYQTIRAENGRSGYDMALKELPDFIILDIQLPDIMGTDVLKMIRNSSIGRSIPIIAMTSYAMSGDEQALLAAGCDGYIEKPINPEYVVEQIKKILGEAQ
ncbi:MAG: response regulator [Desulfobacterales bacterium]|nr:response regulator [Desulfobacterales bacterium]